MGPPASGSVALRLALTAILVLAGSTQTSAQTSPPRPPPPRPPTRPPPGCVNTSYIANTVDLVAAKTNATLPLGWTQALTVRERACTQPCVR